MTRYLLDTNAVLRLAFRPERAPVGALERLIQGVLFVSQVCAIEIAIKHSLGKLDLPRPFASSFAGAFEQLLTELNAGLLRIEIDHIAMLGRLPLHHRDPFDRLLISQALIGTMTLVSSDTAFGAYDGLAVLRI